MKRASKGTTGFVFGLICYIIFGLVSIFSAIGSFVIISDYYTSQGDRIVFSIIGPTMSIVFIGIILWYISFATAYQQGKAQIELLEEIKNKND